MPQADLNQHSDFDRLNIPKLKTIAKRWASEYPEGFIQKILLYSYLSPYNRVFKKTLNSTVPIKYAIVFDISTVWIRLIVEQTQAHYQSDFSGCELCEILGPNVYDKLVDATEEYYTVHEGYPALMSADFENVYKENAKEDFWKEWTFKIIGPDDLLPKGVRTEEPFIVLYDCSGIDENKRPAEQPNSVQAQINSFILKGDYWEIRFRGEYTNIKNLERTRYIIHLLDNPGIDIASHDLLALVKKNTLEIDEDYTKMSKEQLENEGLSLVEHYIEGLSKEEKNRLESMAYQQWNELVDAKEKGEHSLINEKEKRWTALRRHFMNEYGLEVRTLKIELKFIKRKRLKNEAEKARTTVSMQIKTAIADIKKKFPDLGTHLEKNISKGAKCCYSPDESVTWNIEW